MITFSCCSIFDKFLGARINFTGSYQKLFITCDIKRGNIWHLFCYLLLLHRKKREITTLITPRMFIGMPGQRFAMECLAQNSLPFYDYFCPTFGESFWHTGLPTEYSWLCPRLAVLKKLKIKTLSWVCWASSNWDLSGSRGNQGSLHS